MKAAQINEYGGADVLQLVDDAPKPKPGAGEVLVKVYAASVNPFDWKLREGYMKDHLPLKFPATLGGDFAGIVAELGKDVTSLKVGDEVYGQANAVGSQGSYAEFTPVKAESVGPKPKTVDFVRAAALPLAGVSAYQALVDHMNLNKGQKILIHGGAGGIASLAIPLAKHLGAYVATTAAADDLQYVKSLGADQVIDYKAEAFELLLKDYDAVYDTVGGETYTKSFQIVRPGGIIVSMVEQPNEDLMKKHNVKAIAQFTKVTSQRLTALTDLVDKGVIKAVIDRTFPLSLAAEAQTYIQSGQHRGKVVLEIK
jgi:NADPH:quinone reductase-like Zn-dependent oxidoreductase